MSVSHITRIMRTRKRVNMPVFDDANLSISTGRLYDRGMTHAFNTPAVAKEAPRQLSVTDLRSKTSVVLDDARVGHVTYIERGGRVVAAVVPVAVGQAYEAGADTRRAVRDELAGDVWTAIGTITDALSDLLAKVEDPATRQAAAERMLQRFQERHQRDVTQRNPDPEGEGDETTDVDQNTETV